MASTINASNSGFGGIVSTGDSSGQLQLQTANTTAVTIDTSQNVGIGTTSPDTKLTVTGADGATLQRLKAATGVLRTRPYVDATNGAVIDSANLAESVYLPVTINGSAVRFGDNTGTVQTITGGNVGIGTTSPNGKFESYANSGYSIIANSNVGSVAINPSSNAILFGTTNVAAYATGNYDAATHVYKISGTERMRVDSSGDIQIGKTDGSQNTQGIILNSYGTGRFTATGQQAIWANRLSSDGQVIAFTRSTTQVGNISVTTSATTYNSGSDYRLKENIIPMTGALDKVALLNPVTFTWKIDGKNGQGFIAHELAEVIPDAVTGDKDAIDAEGNPEYQSVDPRMVVATLTAAIKEQQTIINDLKARIEKLEAK